MDDVGTKVDVRRGQPTTARDFPGRERELTLGIEQYVWVLRRQWHVIGLLTILGVSLAAAYLLLTPRSAVATTTINLNVIMTEPFSSQRPASGLLDASTEADIARSHVVAARAADILGDGATASFVRSASEVESRASAAVVNVTFAAPSELEAIEGADAVAQAYLEFRREQADSRVATIVSMLTEQIDVLNESLNDINETISSSSSTSSQHMQAQSRQQQILTELDGLLSERNALRSVDTTGGTVLSSAQDNAVYHLPARASTLSLGAGAGLALGIVAAFIVNPLDRRIRKIGEISRFLGAPVLSASPGRNRRAAPVLADGLAIAQERLLTDLSPGDSLLVLDATSQGEHSSAVQQMRARFKNTSHRLEAFDLKNEPASLVAALRNADAAVVLFGDAPIMTSDVRWLRNEAAVSGTPFLGIIDCSRPRRPARRGRVSDRGTTS